MFPHTNGKTIVTGMIAGVLGFIIGQWLLKLNGSLFDCTAFVFPVVMIFQRLGCLFAGCCFGLPTDQPWGVRYAAHFRMHDLQAAQGLCSYNSTFSVPVHPVQLYEVLGYVFIIITLLAVRKKFRVQNAFGFFSLSLVFFMRFIVEFFRDPACNHAWGATWNGLKVVQWVVICAAIISFTTYVFLEWKGKPSTSAKTMVIESNLGRHLLLAFVLVIMLWLVYGWFNIGESLVFRVMAFLALLTMMVTHFMRLTSQRMRWALCSLMAVSVLFMSQTVVEQKTGQTNSASKLKKLLMSYRTGNLNLDYVETITTTNSGDPNDCMDNTSSTTSRQRELGDLNEFGIAFEWLKTTKKGFTHTKGIGFSGYGYKDAKSPSNSNQGGGAGMFYWISPVRNLQDKNYDFKLGLHLGNLNYLTESATITKSNKTVQGIEGFTWIFPILQARIGGQDKIYFVLGLGDDLPNGIAISRYRFGVGIGNKTFGIHSPLTLEAGIKQRVDKAAFYVDTQIGLGKTLLISGGTILTKDPIFNVGLGFRIK
jgi:phosphatidylglycerol:prolipoprotein diacylglycerol transferase